MRKISLVFMIFTMFFLVSCNHIDDDDMIFGDTDADTGAYVGDTDADTADTNADTGDTNVDTADTNPDTGDTNADTGDTNADIGDTNADTGDSDADTGDSGADTGDSGADTGDSGADTGDTNADTGDSGADTGDTNADTGDTNADTGDSGADTGDTNADTGDSGADTGDSGADTGDTNADTGDSGADTGDSGADTGDSGADTGDSGADTGDTGELPECSSTSATPCKAGNLIWSSRSNTTKNWEGAKSACTGYSEGGFTSGWRLPTISELRKIIKNCSLTEPEGACHVTDTCTAGMGSTCYIANNCYYISDVCPNYYEHSLLGEAEKLWSSTSVSDSASQSYAWWVDFSFGAIFFADKNNSSNFDIYYRCVHNL